MRFRFLLEYLEPLFKKYEIKELLQKQSYLIGFKEGSKQKEGKKDIDFEDLKKMLQLTLKRKPKNNFDIEFKSYLRGFCDGMESDNYIKMVFQGIDDDLEHIIEIMVIEELTLIKEMEEQELQEQEDKFYDFLLSQMDIVCENREGEEDA